MMPFVQDFRRLYLLGAILLGVISTIKAQQAATVRDPASKAAAILTWSSDRREQYIAALDSFFLTRTVKAGPHAHQLDRGRPIAAFEAGGSRAAAFDQFLATQRVRGVLVLQDGKVRLERYLSPQSPATRWNSFSIAKSITSTLGL
jgi:CubicO group peptidase (beta-lactamase class C family)